MLVEVKYYGATNTKGSRVRLFNPATNKRVFIPFDYSKNNILDMAVEYLENLNCKIVATEEAKNHYVVIVEGEKSLKS